MPYALPHAMPSGVPRALGHATVNDAMCNCFCNCFYTTALAFCTAIDDAPKCAMCPRLCNSERCNMQLLLQLLMYRMACPTRCLLLQIPPSSLYGSTLRRPSPLTIPPLTPRIAPGTKTCKNRMRCHYISYRSFLRQMGVKF